MLKRWEAFSCGRGPMALTIARSTLMHAALAHVSPELREFDFIAFGKLRRRPVSCRRSLSSLPVELLLLIRTHLLPVLIAHFMAISASALQHYEASLRRLVCPQCRIFYEYVYGDRDVWKWRLAGPCPCAPEASRIRCPNPKQFRDRYHWLETYLSRKSLRFRGLSLEPSPSSPICDLVSHVLREFGCEVALSRRDHRFILVVPLCFTYYPSPSSAKEDRSLTAPVLFRRLERGLGLSQDYAEPCRSFSDRSSTRNSTFDVAASTQFSSDDSPSITAGFPRLLDAVTVPLTAFLTLLFTVLCYYSRPGALRLL